MLAILAFSVALTASSFASAGERDATRAETKHVTQQLHALGYTAIEDVDVQGGRFIVDAVNPRGREVDVILDRRSLRIMRERPS